MNSGKIALICNMYVILNQKMKINCTPLYNKLLPGDIVEYDINDNIINITKILSRKKQYLLGIVKKIENNNSAQEIKRSEFLIIILLKS
jgi:hypothetical protein